MAGTVRALAFLALLAGVTSGCSSGDDPVRATRLLVSTLAPTIESTDGREVSAALTADAETGCVQIEVDGSTLLVLGEAGSALSQDGTAVSFAGLDAELRLGEVVGLRGTRTTLYRSFTRGRSRGWDECVGEARTVEVFVPDALTSR